MKILFLLVSIVMYCFVCAAQTLGDCLVFEKKYVLQTSKINSSELDPRLVAYSEGFVAILTKNKEILVWTDDGRFIGKCGRKGKGPGEYVAPVYLFIDDNSYLKVIDSALSRIHIYFLTKNGVIFDDFIEMPLKNTSSKELYYVPTQIIPYKDNYIFINDSGTPKLHKITLNDAKGNILKKYLFQKKRSDVILNSTVIFKDVIYTTGRTKNKKNKVTNDGILYAADMISGKEWTVKTPVKNIFGVAIDADKGFFFIASQDDPKNLYIVDNRGQLKGKIPTEIGVNPHIIKGTRTCTESGYSKGMVFYKIEKNSVELRIFNYSFKE